MGATTLPTMLLLLLFLVHRTAGACNPIPLVDIKDAVYASTSIYDGYGDSLKEGNKIHDDSDYTVTKVIETRARKSPLKAIVAKNSEGSILVAFRGSSTFYQKTSVWLSGAWAKQDDVTFAGRRCKINSFYNDAMKAFYRKGIRDNTWTKNTKYIITGHSLGGALASLFSIKLAEDGYWKNSDSSMITLGAPRVGNYAYASKHDGLIPTRRKLRLVYNRDKVPHHPGNNPFKDSSYLHHNTEIWIIEKKEKVGCKKVGKWFGKCWTKWSSYTVEEWRVCRGRESKTCSNGVDTTGHKAKAERGIWHVTRYNMADHRNGKYIGAIENLIKDSAKAKQFLRDQC